MCVAQIRRRRPRRVGKQDIHASFKIFQKTIFHNLFHVICGGNRDPDPYLRKFPSPVMMMPFICSYRNNNENSRIPISTTDRTYHFFMQRSFCCVVVHQKCFATLASKVPSTLPSGYRAALVVANVFVDALHRINSWFAGRRRNGRCHTFDLSAKPRQGLGEGGQHVGIHYINGGVLDCGVDGATRMP